MKASWLYHGLSLLLLVVTIVTVTVIYVSSERYFHFWDFAAYEMWTQESFTAFQQSWSMGWAQLQESYHQNYNKLYTLPLLPGLWIFGQTRLGYILSLAIAYLLPFALVMGAIATELITAYPPAVFWFTVLITLCIPASWLPTFQGYPDTGAAVFIGLALWIVLRYPRLCRWWTIPLVGVLIGFAFLWRRHFAYGAIALLLTLGIQGGIDALQNQKSHHNFWRYGIKILVTSLSALLLLAIMAPPVLETALQHNYTLLYQSYQMPYGLLFQQYISVYGVILLVLAIGGYGIAVAERKKPYLTLILFHSISAVQWMVYLRYIGIQYTLHFTPFIILGIATLIWSIKERLKSPIASPIIIILLSMLLLNLNLALTPWGQRLNYTVWQHIFSLNFAPPTRLDYQELVKLNQYLHSLASQEEEIYLVGSSPIFNQSLLVSVDRSLWEDKSLRLYIMFTPTVDSQDWYPLQQLLEAHYVVIANPFQYNIDLRETDVERVVYDLFQENWEIAQDFQRLPETFSLDRQTQVVVYQRHRATDLGTARRTLAQMEARIGDRPGKQPPWISLNPDVPLSMLPQSPHYNLATYFDPKNSQKSAHLLWINPLNSPFILTGIPQFSQPLCPTFQLQTSWINSAGEILGDRPLIFPANQSTPFQLPLTPREDSYFHMAITVNNPQDLTTPCNFGITQLNLK